MSFILHALEIEVKSGKGGKLRTHLLANMLYTRCH